MLRIFGVFNRKWTREYDDTRFDLIDLDQFVSTSIRYIFGYLAMYIGILLAIAAFASDIYTAIVLLAFDRWSSSIEPFVPFRISRWLFAGCIILSVLLFIHDFVVAFTTMRTKNISLNYTDPIARNIYSIKGYKYFCLFAKITKSKGKIEYLALFVYFSFKGWIRLIFADSPRQVLNALTLYSVLQISGDFVSTIKTLAQNSYIEAIVIGFMAFSLLVWVVNIIQFGLALICAIPLYVHIGDQASGLEEYCCVKVNKRIAKLVDKYHKKGMIELAAANKKLDKQPSLPRLDTSKLDDHFNEKAKTHYSVDQLSELYPHRSESIVRNGRLGLNDSRGILRGEKSSTSLNSRNNDNDMLPLLEQNRMPRLNEISPQLRNDKSAPQQSYRGIDPTQSVYDNEKQLFPGPQESYPGPTPQVPSASYINPNNLRTIQNYPQRPPPAYQDYSSQSERSLPPPPESIYQTPNSSLTSLRSDPYRNIPFPDPKYTSNHIPYPVDNQTTYSSQMPIAPTFAPTPQQSLYDSIASSNPYAPELRTVQQSVIVVDDKPKPLLKQHSLPIYADQNNNFSKPLIRQQTLPGRLLPDSQTLSIASQAGFIDNDDSDSSIFDSRKSKLSPTEIKYREPKLPFDTDNDSEPESSIAQSRKSKLSPTDLVSREPKLPFQRSSNPFHSRDESEDLIVYSADESVNHEPTHSLIKDGLDLTSSPKSTIHQEHSPPFKITSNSNASPELSSREPTIPSYNDEDLSIHTPQFQTNPFTSPDSPNSDSFDLVDEGKHRDGPPAWRAH